MYSQEAKLQQEIQLWTDFIAGWEQEKKQPAPPQMWEALDFAKRKLRQYRLHADWLEEPEQRKEPAGPEIVFH